MMSRTNTVALCVVFLAIGSFAEAKIYAEKEVIDYLFGVAQQSAKTDYVDSLDKLQQEKKDLRIVLDKNIVKGCRFIMEVKSNVTIEIWEKKNSCEIVMNDLISKAKKSKGDTLLLMVNMSKCDREKTTGKVYLCS